MSGQEGADAASSTSTPAATRHRSRFPKTQPNLAISSGIARIRRLSGHYANKEPEPSSATIGSAKSPAVASATTTSATDSPQTRSASATSSAAANAPASNEHHILDRSPSNVRKAPGTPGGPTSVADANSCLDENVASNKQTPGSVRSATILVPASPAHPKTPTLFQHTPCGSVYNPRFTSEHIMNIIKHKSLQKLKKIETQVLKEKRRYYKSDFHTKAMSNNMIAAAADAGNSNASDATSSSNTNEATTTGNAPMTIDRSKMRMRDLLYLTIKQTKKAAANKDDVIVDAQAANATVVEQQQPEQQPAPSTSSSSSSSSRPAQATAVPQLKLAADGSIIINEESLLIERDQNTADYSGTAIVELEPNDQLNYNSYRKFHHTKKWTEKETAKFYKALSMIGTDFSMIQRLFSYRTRDELKRKFKREEKLNQALIDKILSKTSQMDLSVFVSSCSEDDVAAASKTNKAGKGADKAGKAAAASKGEKKAKLKRVRKRAFIESESEAENNGTKKNKKKKANANRPKSSQLIEDDSTLSNGNVETTTAPTTQIRTDLSSQTYTLSCERQSSVTIEQRESAAPTSNETNISASQSVVIELNQSSLASVEASGANFITDSTNDGDDEMNDDGDDEDEDEDGEGDDINLIFDLDTNCVTEMPTSPHLSNLIVNSNTNNITSTTSKVEAENSTTEAPPRLCRSTITIERIPNT